jgi:NTE family protein
VFSGGGAKALAHAGAFRALQQAGLEPTHIVATSMGAVIGAALAAGVPFEEVRRRALGLTRRDVAPFNPLAMLTMFARSLIPGYALRRTIARLVPVKGFAGLRIPLTVTATDLDSGELVLFPTPDTRHSATDLHDALYASCALPLYFPPLELDGRRLADGGLRAVLPLEPAKAIPADLVVAVNVGPGFDEGHPPPSAALRRPLPPLIRAHGEAVRIMMAVQAERAVADWPKDGARLVYVRPVHEREATFAVDRLLEYVEAGYQATKKAIA